MQKRIMQAFLLAAVCGICINSFAQLDNRLLGAARQSKAKFLVDLTTLVNIDSGFEDADGLAQVEKFLKQRLEDLGATVEILPATLGEDGKPLAAGKLVLGTLQGSGAKNIMLMIHYDTVFHRGDAANRPFRVAGHKLSGLGVADAKGGALIILYALAIARERGFKGYKTLTVLFNPDEENSSPGSRERIQELSSQQDVVLVFEPPEAEQVTVATNGIARVHLDVDVKGLEGDGSEPEKARNAAIELSNQIMQLKDLGNPAKGTTVTWTYLQAGLSVEECKQPANPNVIPGKASAMADMRWSDFTEIDRVQKDADKIVRKRSIPGTKVKSKVNGPTNGNTSVQLDVKGRGGHASVPEKARNAAIELSNQIMQLKDLGNPAKGTTVTWTNVQTGLSVEECKQRANVNVIPGKASAMADMRWSDFTEIDRVQKDADKIVQKTLIPGTKVKPKVENRRLPFNKNPASDNLAALAGKIYQELGKTIHPVSQRYGTDAGFAYNPKGGKPAVLDGMGIVGDRIHSFDEWADLDSVPPRLYLTVRMLEELTK